MGNPLMPISQNLQGVNSQFQNHFLPNSQKNAPVFGGGSPQASPVVPQDMIDPNTGKLANPAMYRTMQSDLAAAQAARSVSGSCTKEQMYAHMKNLPALPPGSVYLGHVNQRNNTIATSIGVLSFNQEGVVITTPQVAQEAVNRWSDEFVALGVGVENTSPLVTTENPSEPPLPKTTDAVQESKGVEKNQSASSESVDVQALRADLAVLEEEVAELHMRNNDLMVQVEEGSEKMSNLFAERDALLQENIKLKENQTKNPLDSFPKEAQPVIAQLLQSMLDKKITEAKYLFQNIMGVSAVKFAGVRNPLPKPKSLQSVGYGK